MSGASADVWDLCCGQSLCGCLCSMFALEPMLMSMICVASKGYMGVLLRLEVMWMSVAHVTTEGHMDVPHLCFSLKPC